MGFFSDKKRARAGADTKNKTLDNEAGARRAKIRSENATEFDCLDMNGLQVKALKLFAMDVTAFYVLYQRIPTPIRKGATNEPKERGHLKTPTAELFKICEHSIAVTDLHTVHNTTWGCTAQQSLLKRNA